MQYALMIHVAPQEIEGPTDEERQAISREYYALREDPRVIGGAALQPPHSATTVRGGQSTLITDGPFADTREVFGGWYVVDAPDLDVALEIAQRIPALRFGGSVEVRPLVEGPH